MEKLVQGLGIFKDIRRLVFVGSSFPPRASFELSLPIRSRIGTSHRINIDNLSARRRPLRNEPSSKNYYSLNSLRDE